MTEQALQQDQKPYGYIYKVTNLVNGKVYVGQTKQSLRRRWQQHIHLSKKGGEEKAAHYFCRSIRKYGADNFEVKFLDKAADLKELNKKEEYWIDAFKSTVPDRGYNISSGGGKSEVGSETRAKLSRAHKGRVLSQERKDQMSLILKERWKDPKYAKKISENGKKLAQDPDYLQKLKDASTRLWQDPVYRQKQKELNPGRAKTREERLKHSIALTGRAFSAEHCKNISNAKKGKKPNHTEETKRLNTERIIKMNKERFADRWFEVFDVFGKSLGKYNSYRSCAEALKVFPEQIERWLHGKVKSTKYRLALVDNQTGMAGNLVFGSCEVIQAFHSSGRLVGEFRTRAECAKSLNISHTTVGKCLLGKLKMKDYSFNIIKKNEATR